MSRSYFLLAFVLAWGAWGACLASEEAEAVKVEEAPETETEESGFGLGDLVLVGLGLAALIYLYGRRKTEEPK